MIAKAIIKERVKNKFVVRIPLFETAGNPQEVTVLATLCYQPGNLESYNVGDVVFVAFENGDFSNAVIIGKLFIGMETETNSYAYNAAIKAVVSAELPKKTSIGDFSPEEVYSTLKSSPIHEERLTEAEAKLKSITELIEQGGISSYGLRIIGTVTSASELPQLPDPDIDYGDAYLVGSESPYDAYVAMMGDPDYWYNIGNFPLAGPQGETGPTGPEGPEGPQGEDGDPAGFGTVSATATTLASDASATVSVTTSGPDTAKNMQFDFGIPKGAEVVFETDAFSTGWVDVEFKNFTDIKITNSVTTTTVRFLIPAGVSQGWAGSATLKLTTPPSFTISTPGSSFPYDIYYILDGYQKPLNEWQSSLESNITLELMAECNGFDVRIYAKQTKDY